jgi:hypothetical protein
MGHLAFTFHGSGTADVYCISQAHQCLALHVVNSMAFWAFPLIVIYLLGLWVAWIRAGFEQNISAAQH